MAALERERQKALFVGVIFQAHLAKGIENTVHRATPQAVIARKANMNGIARNKPHNKPATCAAIAKIDLSRAAQTARPNACHAPVTTAELLNMRPHGLHRFAGAQNIIAFQQSGEFTCAGCNAAHDQCAMAA